MYGLTPTLKNEIVSIAPRGRVNSVNPGWVATPLAAETLKDTKFVERALATTPLQKVGTPQDVANQVCVLASPVLSGHVNGVNLQVGKSGLCLIIHSNIVLILLACRWWHGRQTSLPSNAVSRNNYTSIRLIMPFHVNACSIIAGSSNLTPNLPQPLATYVHSTQQSC